MVRSTLALSLVALLAFATGCTMCAHPYDYCGPTYTGGCGPCDPNARAGSILAADCGCSGSYGPGPFVAEADLSTPADTIFSDAAVADDSDPQIVARTEPVVTSDVAASEVAAPEVAASKVTAEKEWVAADNPAPETSEQAESQPKPANTLPNQGWRAVKRPTEWR